MRPNGPMAHGLRGGGALVLTLCLILLASCGPRFVEPGAAVGEPRLEDGVYRAVDGVALRVRTWLPDGAPRAVVLALHSFGDYRHAFDDVGPALARAGIATIAPDQRGFGSSPERGRWWGREVMVADARALVALVRARHPTTPLYLLGESMGGAVALVAASGEETVDGLILAAPAVRGELPRRWAWDLAFGSAAWLVPWASRTVDQGSASLTPIAERRLTQDPLVVREVRVDTYWGLLRLANAASAVDGASLPPTLLLFSADDAVVPAVSLCALAAKLGSRDTVRVYRARDHRLLHSAGKRLPLDDVVAWIDGQPLPQGGDAVTAPSDQCAPFADVAAPEEGGRREAGPSAS